VYLHYVFDLWVEAWRKKVAKGDVIVVRYADDLVMGFESRTEAERFLEMFRERLAKFGLELHAEKTRLIEFGPSAEQNRKRRGEAKPETFTFLGFTHYCGKRRSDRTFIVWRKTAKKRMVAKLHALNYETHSASVLPCSPCSFFPGRAYDIHRRRIPSAAWAQSASSLLCATESGIKMIVQLGGPARRLTPRQGLHLLRLYKKPHAFGCGAFCS
jgi:hypothetical protein